MEKGGSWFENRAFIILPSGFYSTVVERVFLKFVLYFPFKMYL